VDWENPEDPSEIVAFCYKIGSEPTSSGDGKRLDLDKKPLVVEDSPEGEQPIYVWLEDGTGNRSHENCAQGSFLFDKTPPEIHYTVNPEPNEHGWNNTDVTVTFECGEDQLSGLASCTPLAPVVVSEEGRHQVVGVALDNAGNRAKTTVTISIDKTKPVIQVGSPQGEEGREGWYISEVAVDFSATDNLAGFPPDGDLTLEETKRTGEGNSRLLTLETSDLASNKVKATAGPFNVDWRPPTGSLTINDGAETAESCKVTLQMQVHDNVSGVSEMRFSNDGQTWSDWESFKESLSNWDLSRLGGNSSGGIKTVYAQVKERAGNILDIRASIALMLPLLVPQDFKTIQDAIDAAPVGGEILIGPGTYEESIGIRKSLILKGSGRWLTWIKGQEAGKPVIAVKDDHPIEVTIEGLTITEAHKYSDQTCCYKVEPKWICPRGIDIRGQVQAVIKSVQISDNAGSGIYIDGGGVDEEIIIQGNEILRNGYYGICAEAIHRGTIEANKVSGNGSVGIRVIGRDLTVQKNEISGNKSTGIFVYFNNSDKKYQVHIESNKIQGNGNWGIDVSGKILGGAWWECRGNRIVYIKNNEISNNNRSGIVARRQIVTAYIYYNDISSNGSNCIGVVCTKVVIQNNTIKFNTHCGI